jgi:hypothetical protein
VSQTDKVKAAIVAELERHREILDGTKNLYSVGVVVFAPQTGKQNYKVELTQRHKTILTGAELARIV